MALRPVQSEDLKWDFKCGPIVISKNDSKLIFNTYRFYSCHNLFILENDKGVVAILDNLYDSNNVLLIDDFYYDQLTVNYSDYFEKE